MKTFLPLISILLVATNCFSQTELKQTDSALLVRQLPYRQTYIYYNPNRPSAAYMGALFADEAKVLPKLHAAKDFAGMQKYLDSVMQKSAGFWSYWRYELAPHIFCVQTLLAIETGHFDMARYSDPGFRHSLADFAHIMRQMNRRGYSRYLTTKGLYDYDGFTDHFMTFVRNWAKDLLATRQLTPNETFLCKTFAGEIMYPVNTILADKATYPAFDSLVVNNYRFDRRTGFFVNFLVSAGVWAPTGNLKNMGNHASIGYNVIGLRDRWNEYDVYFASRFIKSPTTYGFVANDTLYNGTRFYSDYFAFEYTRYIISTPHFETGIIGGAAAEDIQLKDFGGAKSTQLTSGSVTAGLRMNYFFTKYTYIGVSGKYSWLSYQNPGGTAFDGNAWSADIYFGINILAANKGKK